MYCYVKTMKWKDTNKMWRNKNKSFRAIMLHFNIKNSQMKRNHLQEIITIRGFYNMDLIV